jgi:PAS domain-containing protein
VDLFGVVTYANSKWREITGIEERLDDSTGEIFLSAVHPDDRDSLRTCWRNSVQKIEGCTFEVRWGSQESYRWAMGEVVPEVIGEEVYLHLHN